ncbi:MAG TPA: serine/threonine-protein phosphatase [Saprospiraceae bacterium]|nr:serine/threonine-protein phosphatase [Saprospiraceae bacterium]
MKPSQIFSFSHPGKRKSQEDSFYISYDSRFMAICDGVGGSLDGGLASREIIGYLSNLYESQSINKNSISIRQMIKEASHLLNHSVITSGVNISTTLALVYFGDENIILSHIGDSRIFHIKKFSDEYWVSKDHSFVQELYDAGILQTEFDMKVHPMKSRITKALTSYSHLENDDIELKSISKLDKGDLIILCSDGVLETFTNDSFVDHFRNEKHELQILAKALESYCKQYSRDNNTCIIAEV